MEIKYYLRILPYIVAKWGTSTFHNTKFTYNLLFSIKMSSRSLTTQRHFARRMSNARCNKTLPLLLQLVRKPASSNWIVHLFPRGTVPIYVSVTYFISSLDRVLFCLFVNCYFFVGLIIPAYVTVVHGRSLQRQITFRLHFCACKFWQFHFILWSTTLAKW